MREEEEVQSSIQNVSISSINTTEELFRYLFSEVKIVPLDNCEGLPF